MKEPSPELSTPKGAGALSAGVSQSLSKSPIYIKMRFQTCFNFTFPLSSPARLPPHLTALLCSQRLARWTGPSGLPGRMGKALNEGRSRNRSWSRSSRSCDPSPWQLPRGMALAVSPPWGRGLGLPQPPLPPGLSGQAPVTTDGFNEL